MAFVWMVALLAEGVDRNERYIILAWRLEDVALLAEGVDRNSEYQMLASITEMSPSSRRAWIEMCCRRQHRGQPLSPSSRRAWIEIKI